MTDQIAGNGLLNRRWFLKAAAGGAGAGLMMPVAAASAAMPDWMRHSGAAQNGYGEPSRFAKLEREQTGGHPLGVESGSSSTPLQGLNGIITPNSLHFERHHSGIPDIDPARHRLVVHGDVKRPLEFTYEDLLRYPMRSEIYFLECSGNSYRNTFPEAADLTVGSLNGLISCAEWTGVPLAALLDETGIGADARWVVARGDDAAGMARSLPMELALGDAMIALFQNGEPIRPAQGYPMRLFVPGCEGNLSVKWLSQLHVQQTAAYTRDETSKYTDLAADGRSEMFSLRMEVKSLITSPSGTMNLPGRGIYPITGLAWSGHGAIRKVEVSADGGASWAEAELQTDPRPLAPVRFRIPWRWDGGPAVLQSRATDQAGNVQPTRDAALAGMSPIVVYHYNGIQSWAVSEQGRVANVYA